MAIFALVVCQSNLINACNLQFIPMGTPLTGASSAGGVGTNRYSGQIADCRSMTAAVHDQQLMVFRAVVYNSYGACLFMAQVARISEYAEEKRRTQQNLFVRSGKSKTEVTNNRR